MFAPDRISRPQPSSPVAAIPLPCAIQAKLAIGRVDDPLEHEADRVADQVMRTSAVVASVTPAPATLRRKFAAGEEEEATKGKSSDDAGPFRATALERVESTLRNLGKPLDAATQAFFEPRFGRDFSSVRIHDGPAAHESAARLDARAYTAGQAIVFGKGEFAPATSDGRRLLAHELTHVVQQSGAAAPRSYGQRPQDIHTAAFADPKITPAPAKTVARWPRGEGMTEEEGDDLDYRQQDAEDRAQQSQKQVRGDRAKANAPRTAGQVSHDAESEIQEMIGKAKRGDYRYVNTANRQKETNRFRALLDKYRGSELQRIDDAIANLPKNRANKAARAKLVAQKRGIILERSRLMGQFDEPMRTPAGVDAQGPYVHGGQAHDYHETTPGRGSYAQPDYSAITLEHGVGVNHVHVNLKSHDLRDIKLSDARAVAREVLGQAVKNVKGNPKKTGSVGHLPDSDRLVISFIDQPPKQIQDEINEILLSEDSPIAEVRFGSASKRNPHLPAPAPKPPTLAGDPVVAKGSNLKEPVSRPTMPKGSTLKQPPAGQKMGSAEPPHAPAPKPPSATVELPAGTTSKRVGRAVVDVEVNPGGGVRGRVKAIDLSDMPEHDIPLGPRPAGGRAQMVTQIVQLAKLGLSLAREVVDEETRDKLDHVITPIQAHFNDQLKDTLKTFHANYPDAQAIVATIQVEEVRKGYEAAISKMQMPQNVRLAWAVLLALTPDNKRDDNWRKMAENLPKGSVRTEDVQAAQAASRAYGGAMSDAQTQIANLSIGMPEIIASISKRADILQSAGDDLENVFWSLMQSPLAANPVTYFEIFNFYNEAQVFKHFAGALYGLAAEVRAKFDGYNAMLDDLERRHLALKTFE